MTIVLDSSSAMPMGAMGNWKDDIDHLVKSIAKKPSRRGNADVSTSPSSSWQKESIARSKGNNVSIGLVQQALHLVTDEEEDYPDPVTITNT